MNAAVLQNARLPVFTPGSCPVVKTERLTLRPHKIGDATAIAQSLSDFKVSRMLARVPQPYDLQDALDWLLPHVSGMLPEWTLAITVNDEIHIGTVMLEPRHNEWHLGYWLNRLYWDRGYMTEAVGAALQLFFRHMPETPVRSGAFADNLASLNVQRKLGFRITGANEIFSLPRNRMVPQIETLLVVEDFRRDGRP